MIFFLITLQTTKKGSLDVQMSCDGKQFSEREIEAATIIKAKLKELPLALSHLYKRTLVIEHTKPKKGK